MMFIRTIRNIDVNYHAYGDPSQPVLMLIHGLGCSLKYWRQVFAAPEFARYRIVALDLPGFGMSAKPDAFDYDLRSQADIVAALLRAANIPTAAVVGHSMGGTIAILLARQHPGLVERLVVIEPNLRASDAHLSREIIRHSEAEFVGQYEDFKRMAVNTVQHWFVNSQRADLDEYLRELLKTTPISMYRSARSLMTVTADESFVAQFQALPMPKYFLMGAETLKIRNVPDSFADNDVGTVIVPGVGHMMMVDNPALFNRTLAAVLI